MNSLKTQAIKALLLLASTVFLFLFSNVIPPMQSPDEFEHFKRAYALSEGVIVFGADEVTKAPVQNIDTGLDAYFETYEPLATDKKAKLTTAAQAKASQFKWSRDEVVTKALTAQYFPLAYIPQAIAIRIGIAFDLTIDSTYRFARFMNIATCLVLIFLSWRYLASNHLLLLILGMPMVLFQTMSTSLDAITFALTVFLVSKSLAIEAGETQLSTWKFALLAAGFAVLASARSLAFPLLAIPVWLALKTIKTKKSLFIAAAGLISSFAWIGISYFLYKAPGRPGTPTTSPLLYWLSNPSKVLELLASTFISPLRLSIYYRQIVGVLGWLDVVLPTLYYVFFSVVAGVCIVMLFLRARKTKLTGLRKMLPLLALVSFAYTVFALLLVWTKTDAHHVQGLQGRYFIIPVILLALAIPVTKDKKYAMPLNFLVAGTFVVNVVVSFISLTNRYWY